MQIFIFLPFYTKLPTQSCSLRKEDFMFVRLLPVLFSALLFSAHISRIGYNLPAVIFLLLIATLFIRKTYILRAWQIILGLASLIWIQAGIGYVQMRMSSGMPWIRLGSIMAAIVLFTVFSAWWLENKKIKEFYGFKK